MRPLYRIVLFILICWFGYRTFRQTLGAQQSGLLDVFMYYELVLLIILTLIAIAADIVAYRSNPKLFQFYSCITGLLLIVIVFFRLITFSNIQHSPTLFTLSSKAGAANTISIQLKESGYLKLEELKRLGSDIYYGKYFMNKDTLVIYQTNYERFSQQLPFYGIIQHNLLIWSNNDTMEINSSENNH